MRVDLASDPLKAVVANGGRPTDRDAFHVEFDPEVESPTYVVTDAVAMIRDVDSNDLPPLARAVDPDALESLFEGDPDSTAVERVQFVYEGFEVTVESAGHVWLRRV